MWWAADVLVVVLGYVLYSMVRNSAPEDTARAFANALRVENFEMALNFHVEESINALVASERWLAQACNYYYSVFHFVVPAVLAIWLYRRHEAKARRRIAAWYTATALGLFGFWLFPLAPPRMMAGFVDTAAEFETWGLVTSGPSASISNQFAAMPSLHFAWSLWCGVVLFEIARGRWVKALAIAYPLTTLFVIVGTANHYLVDAVAGAAVAAAGFGVVRVVSQVVAARDPDGPFAGGVNGEDRDAGMRETRPARR